MSRLAWAAAAALALAACKGGGDGDGDGDTTVDEPVDVGEEDAGGDGLDVPADTGSDGDAGDPADEDAGGPPSVCESLGMPERALVDAAPSADLGATAAPFSVPTRSGMWSLEESWTGCDVYLVVQDQPEQESDTTSPLWSRDVHALFQSLPPNVHLFFVSTQHSLPAIEASLDMIQDGVEAEMAIMTAEERDWWQDRVHYVTSPVTDLDGWLGVLMADPGWGVGIDRSQRIRYVGSYADFSRPTTGWFDGNLAMLANEAIYYNFEAEREARLEAQDATVIPVFAGEVISDPGWAGVRGYATATLPDADEMAGFDTMELDMRMGCGGEGEYGFCPAWDRIVSVYFCETSEEDSCEREIGRWITTYHREGRWVHDVSALLPLVSAGGEIMFALHSIDGWTFTMDIRLSMQGKAEVPREVHYLFSGGDFNDVAYNDRYDPVTVPIPADATRVELATVLTGHGMASPGNCAEFCNTTHHFFVDGNENVLEFPEAGTSSGCMAQVAEGTVPNQYGTWWYGRSGWCPGKEVPIVRTDVTSQVAPGSDAVFDYEAYYMGSPYSGDSWADISLSSWVVVWGYP